MPACLSYTALDALTVKLSGEYSIDHTDRANLIAAIADLVRCRKHIADLKAKEAAREYVRSIP